MPTKLTITKKKETKFTGADGNVITYYWYKGLRGGGQCNSRVRIKK